MTDFVKLPGLGARLSELSARALATVLWLCVGLSAAHAQDVDMEPQAGAAPPPSVAAPISLFPQESADPAAPVDRMGLVADDIIAVRQLDELSADTLGLIDGFSGGLPVDMWQGTSKELVDILLPKLPAQMESEVMRDLTLRLLLSVARPPEPAPVQDIFVDMTAIVPSAIGFSSDDNAEGASTGGALGSDGVPEAQSDLGILERRLTQLAAMGDWDSVAALAQIVPEASLTEGIRILATDLALVTNRVDDVCLNVSQNLAASGNPYWQKVFAFCQLRDGNESSAFLTLDLLRETGVEDAAFFWVAELMAGNRPITPNGLDRLEPIQLAMLRHAGRPFPIQLVRNGDPTLLRVLAESEPLYVAEDDDSEEIVLERRREAIELRLEAAERAVALGALNPARLRELYRTWVEEVLETEEDTAQSETAAQAPPAEAAEDELLDLSSIPVRTPVDRARLFQLVEAQVIPTAKAEVISRAIDFARNDRGRNGPDVSTMGLVYAPALQEISPTGDLAWFAGNAARALIAAGELESGKRWLELTRLYERTSIEASDVAAAMWPVERQLLPSMTNRFTPLRFKRWEESRPSNRVAADKALVLSTLTAFEESVATVDWMSLMDRRTATSTTIPQPHIWNGLTLAAESGRVGETVLLALLALGEEGVASVSPIVLAKVIESLKVVGLEQDARRLAVEAALVQGL